MQDRSESLFYKQKDAVEEQFAAMAVSHLSDWDNLSQTPLVDEEKFTNDEHNLITIEKARTLNMNEIDDDKYIGRQVLEFKGEQIIFSKWIELLDMIKLQKSEKTRFNILITGLPISGKATARRALTKGLHEHGCEALGLDRDYIKQPMKYLLGEGINIIEDMHGIDQESSHINDLDNYDMVIYTIPNELEHIRMIHDRGEIWRESVEKVDLTDGTGTADDDRWTRLFQSMRSESRAQQARENWLEIDETTLYSISEKIPVIKLNPVEIIADSYQSN